VSQGANKNETEYVAAGETFYSAQRIRGLQHEPKGANVETARRYSMIVLAVGRRLWATGCAVLAVTLLWQVIEPPAKSWRSEGFDTSYNGKSYATYRIDLRHQHLELWSKDETGARIRNAGALKTTGEKRGNRLLFATNAGIFSSAFVPLGLYIERGQQLVSLNTDSGPGNFYMKPNGVFSVAGHKGSIVTTQAFNVSSPVDYATQSGPLLLEEGTINSLFHPHSTNRLVRSGVGIRGESEVFFAISNDPVNFYEFALLFRDKLGCTSALYLDGVISAMYAADRGRNQTSGDFAAMFALFEKLPHDEATPESRKPNRRRRDIVESEPRDDGE
jgi:uncharacterized protein YigE (DUF2233 family)